ncbi:MULTISPECIES: hypothetical protein [Rhodanobacter]|uniref:hypothetical protein n=1 Tax=Rhodanobacter TaxID=75309 RepID=UPI000B2F6C28|nr:MULTISPECIES: hypothetical protein [Rhodanobacter]UJJ49830.1 hypothetical protein LRK52_11360 [Rhodanobacter denitrificans]UJM92543.1 hypothetical protein LRK32_11270 [Rhodanobacter denitrificans]UJM96073.1 hypothetical protein LRK44_11275 [Rhodanobacter denitrificans]UJN21096.1 hypothetical protein LRK54_15365 [Rhodanobacter denitrificans]
MPDRITQRPPRYDQCEPRQTLIPPARLLSEIVPDTFLQEKHAGTLIKPAATE